MGRLVNIILISILMNLVMGKPAEKIFKSAENNEYYIEANNKFTWQESFDECKKRDMELLTVEAVEKSNEIKELLKKIFTGKNIPKMYIGANDLKEFRQFSWVVHDDQSFEFENWEENEPNNYQQLNERCVHIGFHGNDQWNDINCNRKYGFICQEKFDFANEIAKVDKA